MRRWKSECEAHHGSKCLAKLGSPHQPSTLFIDVDRMCLVPSPKKASYVALSYVWGKITMLKTKRDNLAALRKINGLGQVMDKIPTTILDALKLVRLLGERYLWVDSLCIIQDDTEFLQNHLSKMAAIFEHATLTIVAADGSDASHGLCGISRPRTGQSPVLRLTRTMSVTAWHRDPLVGHVWSTRGWTMQEQLFSRRMLVFFDDKMK